MHECTTHPPHPLCTYPISGVHVLIHPILHVHPPIHSIMHAHTSLNHYTCTHPPTHVCTYLSHPSRHACLHLSKPSEVCSHPYIHLVCIRPPITSHMHTPIHHITHACIHSFKQCLFELLLPQTLRCLR